MNAQSQGVSPAKAGFRYLVEVVKDGQVIDSEVVDNLIPVEGINHILNVVMNAGSPVTTWYLGLYEGNYTPQTTDTAATLPAAATECTAYSNATRWALITGSAAAGVVDNSANKTEFTFTADKTVYGGFISSVSGKGATSGVLVSVVKFASAKVMTTGAVLRVTAGLSITST